MSLECKYCQKKFNTVTNLNRHQRTTRSCIKIQKEKFNIDNVETTVFKCVYCDKNYTSKQSLDLHISKCSVKETTIHLNNNSKEIKQQHNIEIQKLKNRILELETELSIYKNRCDIDKLQETIEKIALTAIDQKNDVIAGMVKKYVKKQPRKQFDCSNVVYILTTPLLKKDRRYILGKAKNLTNRLSTYNKTDEHEVIYYHDCGDEETMNALEPLIFKKLSEYREQANRERFILPENSNINFFINTIKDCFEFLK